MRAALGHLASVCSRSARSASDPRQASPAIVRPRPLRSLDIVAIAATMAALPTLAVSSELRLVTPVACDFDSSCYIQRLVDHDPGPGIADAFCGTLTGDGHKGTDFALPSLAHMDEGVAVLAAAAGVVSAVRDGMPDIAADDPDAPSHADRECGNGVVIAHGNGWETQYCHMKRGTLTVAPGDAVGAGQQLGRIGLSGATTYPHLHLSVRRNGVVVDPFATNGPACDAPAGTLFAEPPTVLPGGVIAAGIAKAVPDYATVKAGTAGATSLSVTARQLVAWGYVFGGLTGDIVEMTLDGPGGRVLQREARLESAQPLLFRAAGGKMPPGGWRPGLYRATVMLVRGGDEVDRKVVTVMVD